MELKADCKKIESEFGKLQEQENLFHLQRNTCIHCLVTSSVAFLNLSFSVHYLLPS